MLLATIGPVTLVLVRTIESTKKQITFKIGGGAKGGINYVRITLTSMDVYNMEFIKARGTDLKVVATEDERSATAVAVYSVDKATRARVNLLLLKLNHYKNII